MIVIAVLLIAAIVALTIGVFLAQTEGAGFEVLEDSFTVSGGALFTAGLMTGLALVATIWMLTIGLRRATIRRKEIRDLRTAHQRQQAVLEQERMAFEAEKEELRKRPLVRPYIGQGDRPPEHTEQPREPAARPGPPPEPPRPLERRPPFGPPGQPTEPTSRAPNQGPTR